MGNTYAVNFGKFRGQLFVFVKKENGDYGVLSIPLMERHKIPKKEFENALSSVILSFVERLPRYVRKTIKFKYENID